MIQSLPKGGNAALAQADPTARTLFIGLNWDLPATASPVEIDASLFLLNTAGVVRDDRDFIFYNQETDASGAVYRKPSAELDPAHDRDGFVVTLPALSEDVQRLAFCLTLDATFGTLEIPSRRPRLRRRLAGAGRAFWGVGCRCGVAQRESGRIR